MKRILILLLILRILFPITTSAQDSRYKGMFRNSVSVMTNASNWGYGFGYSHSFNKYGFYTRLSQGQFGEANYYGIDREYKASAGLVLNTKPDPGWWPSLTAGFSLNQYTFQEGFSIDRNAVVSKTFGLEFGVMGQIGRYSTFCTTDLIKWQFMFGIGYAFN